MPKLKIESNGQVIASSHKNILDLLGKIRMINDSRTPDEKIVATIEFGKDPVFQQGALDTLFSMRQALDRAINAYEKCRNGPLSLDSGFLFETLDNIQTIEEELETAIAIMHQ